MEVYLLLFIFIILFVYSLEPKRQSSSHISFLDLELADWNLYLVVHDQLKLQLSVEAVATTDYLFLVSSSYRPKRRRTRLEDEEDHSDAEMEETR